MKEKISARRKTIHEEFKEKFYNDPDNFKFVFTDEEWRKFHEWRKHPCDAIHDVTCCYYIFKFFPSTIDMPKIVECACGASIDLTEDVDL